MPVVGGCEVVAAEGVEHDVEALPAQRGQGAIQLLREGLPAASPH